MPERNPVEATRFQAQVHFGLVAPHDVLTMALLLLSWAILLVIAIVNGDRHSFTFYLVWAGLNILLGQIWLVVLVYRALVWILDMRSEINLMPQAAARIVSGYFEGTGSGTAPPTAKK